MSCEESPELGSFRLAAPASAPAPAAAVDPVRRGRVGGNRCASCLSRDSWRGISDSLSGPSLAGHVPVRDQ